MFTSKKIILFLCLFLTACGYQPLYTLIDEDISKISVGKVKMRKVVHKVGERRAAQTVYKKLSQAFNGDGKYKVNVDMLETVSTLAIRRDATDQRSALNLNAYLDIIDTTSGNTIFETTLTSSVAYNVEDTPFATDAGKERAKTSAAIALSDEIIRTVSLYFRQKKAVK